MSSSSSEKPRYRTYACSTPILDYVNDTSSPQTSAINKSSSSSSNTQRNRSKSEAFLQYCETIRKRKRPKANVRKKRTKRRPVLPRTSDSDWETQSEQFVLNDISNAKADSNKENSLHSLNMLYQDVGSPETTRRAYFMETQLESPLFQPTRRQVIDIAEEDFEQQKRNLELEEMPDLNLLNTEDVESLHDSPLIIDKDSVMKVYPPPIKKRKVRFVKSKEWLIRPRMPVGTSNLLWDNFLKTNPDVAKKYKLLPTSHLKNSCSFDYKPVDVRELYKRYLENENKDKRIHTHTAEVKSVMEKKTKKKSSVRREYPELETVRFFLDKESQEMKQDGSEYLFPETEDTSLISDDNTGKRMSFGQFRQKMKEDKKQREHVLRTLKMYRKEISLERTSEENAADELTTSRLKRRRRYVSEATAKRRKLNFTAAKEKRIPQITSVTQFRKHITRFNNKWTIEDL